MPIRSVPSRHARSCRPPRVRLGAAAGALVVVALGAGTAISSPPGSQARVTDPAEPPPPAAKARKATTRAAGPADFAQPISGTAVSIEMIGMPGLAGAGGAPIWVSKTEITWDAYDVFVYGLDRPSGAPLAADAVTRPSKPYISMDRGFGHAGFPALSMSHHGAVSFCRWLSKKSGRTYRLPTEAEWDALCKRGGITPQTAAEHAWFADNAEHTTHAVASLAPDALGLYDLWGNASEWCTTKDGKPITRGGTFRDPADAIGCAARVPPVPAWNASDPQFPKSKWWLADAGWVGFRIVCEGDAQRD